MSVMTVVWAVLALLLALDVRKVRARMAAIPVLAPSDEPAAPDHRFLVAKGVTVDEATRRAASAHARAHGLGVLDLVPGDLGAMRAWGLLQLLDPSTYRKDRLGRGVSAGQAILVTADVLERAQMTEAPGSSMGAVAFAKAAGRLKHYACTTTDLAVAPGLHAAPEEPGTRRAVLREVMGGGTTVVLVVLPLILAVLAFAAATNRVTGWLPLVVFQIQPLLALAGGRLGSRGLVTATLFRAPLELWGWLLLLADRTPVVDPAALVAMRPAYDALVTSGTAGFFEPRIERCPICGGGDLSARISTVDLLQHKPGRFTLEQCKGCAHVFQNPRLSFAGLDYYYRDFYDGLGEDDLEGIFGAQAVSYLARARMVAPHLSPTHWLDVGGGHGHFCCAARDVWPATRFDALDLSESIQEGRRRGWVDACYRGLFPELAPTLAGAYDVVSMSHYLEHTRDPAAEIRAAREALGDGGLLMIEVPDPACVLGRVLGRLWLPWFQPQHQHLLSVENLGKLLRETGFETLAIDRGAAHQKIDFFAAVYLLLDWIGLPSDRPWLPSTRPRRLFRTLVFALGVPAILWARLMDELLAPVFRRWATASNTYRVLARKGAGGARPTLQIETSA
jgi:SAM-dependent methyltransferase